MQGDFLAGVVPFKAYLGKSGGKLRRDLAIFEVSEKSRFSIFLYRANTQEYFHFFGFAKYPLYREI